MIKAIIFDFGSVLFKEDWIKLSKEMEKKAGISTLIHTDYSKKVGHEWKKASIGKSRMKEVFRRICEERKINGNLEKICREYIKSYNKSKKLNKPLIKKIKSLKKKYLLICHTDTNEFHFEGHKRQGLLRLFHKHFASHLIGKRKYDKKAFKIVLKKLKLKPAETVFIDDTLLNIKNARSLGMNAIQFKNNNQLFRDLRRLNIPLQ
jgi:putative hydrolase of the HAD superfamily